MSLSISPVWPLRPVRTGCGQNGSAHEMEPLGSPPGGGGEGHT